MIAYITSETGSIKHGRYAIYTVLYLLYLFFIFKHHENL